jgi:DNA-binding XRE family transcriptional regulator
MRSLPELLGRLGRVIAILRKRAGYTSQERFARAIRIHRTNMGLLERGRAPNPTMKTLNSVALGLGVTIPDLFTLAISDDSVKQLATGIAPTQQVPPLPPPRPEATLERLQSKASGRAPESPGRTRRKGKRGK